MYPAGRSLKDRLADAADDVRATLRRWRANLARMRREGMTARERRACLALGVACVVAVVVCLLVAVPIVQFVRDPANFQAVLQKNYAAALLLYGLVNTIHVFIAIIPGEPLELGAGLLFGTTVGTLVVSVGLALGELLVFLLVRRFGTRFVHLFVSQEKLDGLVLFNDEKRRNVITFLMMFIPGAPKDIWSYVVGLTPMRLSTWMAISIVARVPSIWISVVVGSTAASGRTGLAGLLFVLVILLSACGIYYYVVISRQAKQAAALDEVARREWERDGRRRNDALA